MAEEAEQKLGTRIIPRLINEEMKQSYLDYSMSVIVGRALPDVRDGLKPVHRRVLYTMWEIGLTHDKPFKKSANVVGNCMARFHPHSDAAIYDTIVRLAQDFSMRYPLVDGQGNFGCFTADTKVKLTDGRDLSFAELVEEHKQGKKNYTYTVNSNGSIEIGEIKNPRMTKKDVEIMKVILDNGEEIKCTLSHKFMLRDGRYKEAKDLKSGDSLMPLYTRLSTIEAKLNHKVLRIEFLEQFEDVYDLTVEGTHNFALSAGVFVHNSIDGDPAAAMRYTECRLTRLAEEMLEDIDKRTVRFIPNFDNSVTEPVVMPSKLPNLLLNGSSGIAVGMATNIPPHNAGEVIDAVTKQIDNPEIEISDILQIIHGPDFPTGALIYGRNGINEAYSKGRGKLLVRAKTAIEQDKSKSIIIVNEIPFMVNKSELLEEMADLVRDKKIIGISDIRDESDRHGIRVVIELKKDSDANVVLNQLFEHTRMQVTFGIIMLALVNNEPKVLNIKQLIYYYIEHRKDVVRKRTLFDLNKAQTRAHLLEGLMIALKNINNVIRLIRESKSVETASQALTSAFNLTKEQATAILEMRLQRLTSLEQEKISQEHKDLIRLIEELTSILSNPQKILGIIKKELSELRQKYNDKRRTEIIDSEESGLETEDLIKDEEMVITITNSGYIKRLPLQTYKLQHRGGKGVIATTTKEEDIVKDLFVASTHSLILFFTNKGKVHWLKVYSLPEASRIARGKAVVNLLQMSNDETVTAFIPVREFDNKHYLIMSTKKGTVKKTELMAYSNPRRGGIAAITLDEKDELINVELTDGSQQIMLATKDGLAVRFKESDVRSTGRSAQGVRGISLKGSDEVIGMELASDEKSLLSITENGYGKRTPISEYRLINRGGSGVINMQCSERNGSVVSICSVADNDDIIFISKNGIIIRVPASDISVIGRNTQGVKIMKMEGNDKVVSAVKVPKENNGSQ